MLILDDCKENCRFYRLKTSEIIHISFYLKTIIFLRYFTKKISSTTVFDIFNCCLLQWLWKADCQVGMFWHFDNLLLKIQNFPKNLVYSLYLGVFTPWRAKDNFIKMIWSYQPGNSFFLAIAKDGNEKCQKP